jgi:hypothetical protein
MCQKSKKSCLEPETVEMPEFEEALPHRTQVIGVRLNSIYSGVKPINSNR